MVYDPTKLKDWQIAEEAEKHMPTPEEWRERLGLQKDEIIPYGRICKLDFLKIYNRVKDRKNGKYIDVTAITPTPLGEGKSTTTLGVIEGLGKRGKNVGGCIRQPSGGPTMNIKGTAAGGGNALLIPMTEFSLGLTGDIDAIEKAHNLALVALTARMQHEANYSDEELLKRTGMRRLNIDPKRVQMGWAMDFCAQALRHIIIGIGTKMDGVLMESMFQITVSSELMAILSIAKDLKDLRERIGKVIVAYSKDGTPITTSDLEVAGAMCAWMRNTINPTLMSTAEYQPCLVHAGPFANIAIGQSSIIGDLLGLKLFDYHVTESGFGADIGFEKFWNVKCRLSGLVPNVVVIVATVRALKMHGGGPKVTPGLPLAPEYTQKNVELVKKGIPNLLHHIQIVKKSGCIPIVSINHFETDTEEELEVIKKSVEEVGVRCAVSKHWRYGGEGILELTDMIIDACEESVDFKFLYPEHMPLREKVNVIAKEVYGADGVSWTQEAEEKAKEIENDPKMKNFSVMMVKTHLSLSHEPSWKGVPKGWTLPIKDVLIFAGAEFVCPMAGTISLMPGTSSNPAFRRVDVDTTTGKVMGLF